METIFIQLKKARESKGLSVADVAAATNINPEFLKAIEEGRTTILPQAYVRAFLREFASVVGLDPQRVMDDYDAETTTKEKPEPPAKKVQEKIPPEQSPANDSAPLPASGSQSTGIAAVIAVVILGAVLYWNFSRPSPDQAEVGQVQTGADVSEQEETVIPVPPPERKPETTDSLRLRAQTSDTVWVHVVIDSHDSLDYILYPNTIRRWTAGNSFLVSVGRPEAVQFTLNDVEMGTLGSSRVIRGRLIDRTTLARLRKQN